MQDNQTSGPVFITGSPRSGTSIFTVALKEATGITAFAEGHLLDLYGQLKITVDRHYRIYAVPASDQRHALGNIPADRIKRELALTLLRLSDEVHGGPTWLDKTGGTDMLEFLRILTTLDRPFVTFFLYRRPLENVVSRLRKFPKHDLAYHAQDWTRIMRAWRDTRAVLPEGSWLEVEQKDIADAPDRVAADVAKLMNLTRQQQTRMTTVMRNRRTQMLASETVGRTLTIEQAGWDAEQQNIFRREVDDEMQVWGFTYDERYRVPV